MNIKYFAILIMVASLSLSGCAYKTTKGGFNFEAQVVTKDGFPTLIAKCTPTESKADLEITGDLIPKLLKKFYGGIPDFLGLSGPSDTAPPSSPPVTDLASIVNSIIGSAFKKDSTSTSTGTTNTVTRTQMLLNNPKLMELLEMQAERAKPLKDVLEVAMKNGSLACPPSGRQELNRVKVPGIQRPIGAQSQ